MDAIILAGGIPLPGETLYPFTRGIPKAMLEVAGKPMIQWVLGALSGAKSIENVVIAGLPSDTDLNCGKKLHFMPNQSGMVENLRAGAARLNQINPHARNALVISSDIPAISAEMIEWVIGSAKEQNKDVFYNIISREVMEKRFPGAHRTYLHLKDLVFCSADAHVVSLRLLLQEDIGIWRKITNARKSPLKQAALIGFDTVLLYLLRLMTVKQAEAQITKRLKVSGRVDVSPYAELGMDVDKPRHLEIIRADLQ
jgi:GTP:adenosylcobinamide-phosphate guanylyltransferase